MKTSDKSTRKQSAKRELFAELTEGIAALADARKGKRTLRTHSVEIRVSLNPAIAHVQRFREKLEV